MQKCSARATATPSGSRSDEPLMHAQRGGDAFRSGQRSHFQVLLGLLPDMASALCVIPLQFDFVVLPKLYRRSETAGRSRSRKQKKTAAGKNRAAGRDGPQAEARVSFHPATRPTCEIFSPNGCGCRCALRLWNPEIIDSPLPAPLSHVGQPSGLGRALITWNNATAG